MQEHIISTAPRSSKAGIHDPERPRKNPADTMKLNFLKRIFAQNVEKMLRAFILIALAFSSTLATAQNGPVQVQLKEAEMLAESLREENRELKNTLAEKERQLAEIQSKYAELILRTDRQIGEMTALQLSAAHLLRSAVGETPENSDKAAEILDAMALIRRRVQEVAQALERHLEKMAAVMDALKASDAVRKEAEKEFAELKAKMQKCSEPLMLSAAQRNGAVSCSILKLDAAAGIAVLDQGSLHGVRSGDEFILQRGEKDAARLKVIESRPLHSAALITAGDKKAAVPGSLLKRAAQ